MYSENNIAFSILDVFGFEQNNTNAHMSKRNFHALSFRIDADTMFKYKNKQLDAASGSVAYVPANTDYKRISKKDSLIVVHFELFNYTSTDIQVITPKDYAAFKKAFENILSLWNGKESGYRYHCSALFYEILAMIQTEMIENGDSTYIDPRISEAVDYIIKHYAEPSISVNQLAKMSYMSETYFRELFKQSFSVSPKKYITNLRINQATSLLNSKYFSIAEVCEKSGFCDQRYFSTAFKQITGVSPSDYSYGEFNMDGIWKRF